MIMWLADAAGAATVSPRGPFVKRPRMTPGALAAVSVSHAW